MQFEEFDKKVKAAADHHHPAYDELAWGKMEKLLDKHMPVEKDDRKRFLFFLFLFLVLGGTGLLIAKPWKGRKIIAATEQPVQKRLPEKNLSTLVIDKVEANKKNDKIFKQGNTNTSKVIENIKTGFVPGIDRTVADLTGVIGKNKNSRAPGTQNDISRLKTKSTTIEAENRKWKVNDSKDKPAGKQKEEIAIFSKANLADLDVKADQKQDGQGDVTSPLVLNDGKPAFIKAAKIAEIKEETLTVKQNTEKKERNKIKKQNSFLLTVSTGPDVSYVSNDKLGTARNFFGAGLGYTFNNRITLRTGFYSGRKIYTATSEAYHPPDIFYVYYPYLEKVDADCKVFEIPLSISYHFTKSTNKSFFASAGISSYLMKSEKYNYTYKYYPTGPTLNKQWAIKNQNKHYFSGITLSAGYQQNLNKHITLIIEPYLKVPLTGIGYGKVKLNSGGVLFTIGIKPFK